MRIKKTFTLLLFFISSVSFADTLTIGLFNGIALHSLYLKHESASFMLKTDSSGWSIYKDKEPLQIQGRKNNVSINFNNGKIITAKDLYISPLQPVEIFFISIGEISGHKTKISGRLHFFAVDGSLNVLYDIPLEDYIAAVVDGEAGRLKPFEFYKAQAILIRTYTLAHRYRHVTEGYDLCDDVHCQKFNGITDYPDIIKAAEETKDIVLIDASYNYITAAYFSNCGGWTANSKDVWQIQQPYLVEREDTFCTGQKHSRWVQKTTLNKWRAYLFKMLHDSMLFSIDDTAFAFSQPKRFPYYKAGSDSLPFTVIRNGWKLNSAFFNVLCLNDSVIFDGRGYGHGVGLCQEGAMKMAEKGYSCKEILFFYFPATFLIDKNAILFFSVD